MAIIYSYPTAVPKLIDKIIITQSYDVNAAAPIKGNPTRAALISDIVDLTGVTSGTANTLPIFTGTGLADSLIRQDSGGIVYIGPEENVRFTGTSVNAPIISSTDIYATNITGSSGGTVSINGNTIIGNEVTDTLVVNSVSTFNADLITYNKIGIKIANPQRELDVDGGVRIRGTLDLFQGNNNSFAGQNAGNLLNITAGTNTGFGKNSQLVNISGGANTSMGASSLEALVTGNENTAIGINSMLLLNGGNRNVAVGADSLSTATTGNGNTAIGHNSLGNTTTTFFNTAVGEESLANITTGTTNTGIGNKAGKFTSDGTTANATGNYSVFIGDSAKAQANAQNNQIVIGYNTIGNGTHTATIGNSTTTALHVGGNNAGIVLKSPDGTAYKIKVTNAGALTVTAL